VSRIGIEPTARPMRSHNRISLEQSAFGDERAGWIFDR